MFKELFFQRKFFENQEIQNINDRIQELKTRKSILSKQIQDSEAGTEKQKNLKDKLININNQIQELNRKKTQKDKNV